MLLAAMLQSKTSLQPLVVMMLMWLACCALLPTQAQAQVLLDDQGSLCPLLLKSSDINDTVIACARGSDPSSLVYNVPCCTRVAGLLYQSWVRWANTTDQLLMTQEAALQCTELLTTTLMRAGILPSQLAKCNNKTLSLYRQSCGENLTTVEAFKRAANYSYPGAAVAACWNQPDCTGCKVAMTNKIASLSRSASINGSLIATDECQELASVALVAAAYPLVLANSIAQCLWNSPVDYLPQSTTCTTQDFFNVDYTAAYKACGAPKVHGDRCCDILFAMQGQVFYAWSNKTGLIEYQTEVDACIASYRVALAVHGLPGSLIDQCKISSFIPLLALRCSNYTRTLPKEALDRTEAACAPGHCNMAGDCTDVLLQTSQALRKLEGSESPLDQLTCILFLTSVAWPQYGSQGAVDRLNCYYDLPPEIQVALAPVSVNQTVGMTIVQPGKRKESSKVPLIVSLVAGVVVLIMVLGCAWWFCRIRSSVRKSHERELFAARAASLGGTEQVTWFSFSELRTATQNFSDKQLLGRGGSGKVYLGRLSSGLLVAVKDIMKPSKPGAVEEFITEVVSMVSCRHRHIVAPRGVHASEDRCMLVYEYVPKGSLEDHLFPPRGDSVFKSQARIFLGWPQRIRIAVGTAKGLAFLHEDCNPRIIHRDVKPSNILLDDELEAKVADFGLAKFSKEDETHISTGVRGTWGYISPEYVSTGQVTDKSDVYSFGVVLLSLVTGRRPMDTTERSNEPTFLTEWAWDMAEMGSYLSLVDPGLAQDLPEHEASILVAIKVGLMCVHTVISQRPSMQECVAMLSMQARVPELPRRPLTFFSSQSERTDEAGSFVSLATRGSTSRSDSTPSWLELSLS